MILLQKLDKPSILESKASEWTQTLVEKAARGEKPTDTEKSRYRHPQIKQALVQETNGKCAYCESKLLHITHGDVEHIYPKSLDVSKTFEWENLTLACDVCNEKKSNLDPYLNHIIDPYNIDPIMHLIFTGPYVFSTGSISGKNTITILEFNKRIELVERRKEHLEKIMLLYETIQDAGIPISVRKLLYKDLVQRYGNGQEQYTGMIKCLIIQMRSHIPTEIEEA